MTAAAHRRGQSAQRVRRNRMFSTLSFIGKWKQWYRVLRYRKGFGLLDSVRYGLWLAHS